MVKSSLQSHSSQRSQVLKAGIELSRPCSWGCALAASNRLASAARSQERFPECDNHDLMQAQQGPHLIWEI